VGRVFFHGPSDDGKQRRGQASGERKAGGIACGAALLYSGPERGRSLVSTPTVDPEPARARKRSASRSRRRPRRARRWLLRIFTILFLIGLAPLLLTLLYTLPAVHPISTLMAKDLATFRGYDRQWAPIEDIAPVLVHSVIMSEDGQFCSHRGIDWKELNLVIDDALAGEATRGASTIPMQTVKNLFLWHGRSFIRKLLEAPLAIYFDAVVSKKRIMEIYLNIAEWGPGIYGAEAAAQHHFGKPASELTRRESALLAAALPNPYERNPAAPGPGLQRVASTVEKRASQAGGYVGCVQ
jgi:monofunctional biosynthetic peptidoglycan transglycosylase